MSSEQASEEKEVAKPDLIDDDGFWRLLLGARFDKLSDDEKSLDRLAAEFYRGRKEYIDPKFGSKDEFIDALYERDTDTCVTTLLSLWAEQKWENKSTGDEFSFEQELSEELEALEEGTHIEHLDYGLTLVWPSKEVRRPVLEDDSVRSYLLREARPLYLRESDGNQIEIRGPARRVNRFTDDLTDRDTVTKVERLSADESVIEELEALFTEDIETLDLIEIDFSGSRLPNGSGVTLSNPDGISGDFDEIRPQIIDIQTLADLRRLKFRHKKTGNQITIKTVREDAGFYFEIDDSYLSEEDKANVQGIIEGKLGISFDRIYPYDVQHNDTYIVHRILTGSADAYNRYYADLDEEDQEFVDHFAEKVTAEVRKCMGCGKEFEEKFDECDDCGNTSSMLQTDESVEVDHDAVFAYVQERFDDLNETISEGQTRLVNVQTEPDEIAGTPYIRASFDRRTESGRESDANYYEYYLYCYGEGRVPYRINRYLLNAALVTYGEGYTSTNEHFGEIDLHTLYTADDTDELFFNAVETSHSKLRNRIAERVDDAVERLQDLQQKVDHGVLEERSKDELKDEYDSKNFERDVFYLLKSLFIFTERWGREGKTETDGCLIIPEQEDAYFVASYDPKLTYDVKGYDLDAEEKNKAAFYLLSEQNDDYIRENLKKNGSIDGHIFVSDLFREGQYDTVPDRVQEWFALVEEDDPGIDLPVIFLPLEQLLAIYDIFDSHYDQIEAYNSVRRVFREGLIEQLRVTERGRCIIDDDAVEQIEQDVIRARDAQPRSRQIQEYSDS